MVVDQIQSQMLSQARDPEKEQRISPLAAPIVVALVDTSETSQGSQADQPSIPQPRSHQQTSQTEHDHVAEHQCQSQPSPSSTADESSPPARNHLAKPSCRMPRAVARHAIGRPLGCGGGRRGCLGLGSILGRGRAGRVVGGSWGLLVGRSERLGWENRRLSHGACGQGLMWSC